MPNVRFTNGIVGQAFACDPQSYPYGTYVGVRIADQPAYALTNSLTIEAWIRPRGDGYVVLCRGDNRVGLDPYALSMEANNILNFTITSASGNSATVRAPLVYNQWWHVAATLEGASGRLSLFTNGTLAAQITTTVRPFGDLIPQDAPGIGIGNVNDNFNNFPFYGDIDEVSLYNRALSAADIAAIYNADGAGKCAPSVAPSITAQPSSQAVPAGSATTFTVTATGTMPLSYQWRFNGTNVAGATGTSLSLSNVQLTQAGSYSVRVTNAFGSVLSSNALLTVTLPQTNCLPAPAGLVSWWRGDGSTLDAADGNNGTVAGYGTFGYGPGRVGQAFVFDGIHRDRVDLGNRVSLRLQELTIEAWVKRASPIQISLDDNNEDGAVAGEGGIVFGYGRGGYGFGLLNNGQLLLSRIDLDGIYSISVVADTNWHHVAVTKSGATAMFYIDGAPASGAIPYTTTYTFDTSAAIGSRGDARGGTFFGMVDEPSVYGRALSSSEIQALYNAAGAGKCAVGLAPSITTQPLSQTVFAGSNATFTVIAAGTPPLGYQWRKGGIAVAGSTNPTLRLSNTTTNDSGAYDVVISNSFGAVTSQVATLTVRVQAPQLLNVNFAAYSQVKLGFAGTGQTPSDFWNNYTAPWQSFAWLSNLVAADGSTTPVGLTVQNGAGHWSFTHPDLMYNCFCYSQDNGDITLTVTNLPSGDYDFYLYGHSGAANGNTVFQLLVDGVNYGNLPTGTNADSLSTNWVEGAQYVVYRNVAVTNGGAPVTIKAHPGQSGYAMLNGLQIALANRAPVARCADVTVSVGTNCRADASVNNGSFDPDGDPITVSQVPPGPYPVGTNRVSLTVSDNRGASNSCSALVIVQDRTAPVILCASNKVVECGTAWTFDPPSALDSCSATNLFIGVASTITNARCGGTFTATRTWVAVDSSSNAATCSQTVMVVDTTPPAIVCPASQTVEFQDEHGAVASYGVTASDTCSSVSLAITPASGSVFPIGITPVQATATDACSNGSQCAFTVTVLGAPGVKSNVLAELVALRSSLSLTNPFALKFEDAIQHLRDSLNPAYWIDQTHLHGRGGNTAMNEEKLAAAKLAEIMDAPGCPVAPAVLQGFIDRIVKCDRLLAIISIQEAASAGLNPKKVAQDYALVAKGDREAAAGHYANAIEHYRNAWRHALQLQLQVDLNVDGSTRLRFVGNNSTSYLVEVSTDMVNWVSLGTCTADAQGEVEFTDPAVASRSARFYRAVEQ